MKAGSNGARNFAVVIVNHVRSTDTRLHEILPDHTSMPVQLITDRLDTARQPDMPESAIESGFVDFVLSPEEIARKIVAIAHADAAPN